MTSAAEPEVLPSISIDFEQIFLKELRDCIAATLTQDRSDIMSAKGSKHRPAAVEENVICDVPEGTQLKITISEDSDTAYHTKDEFVEYDLQSTTTTHIASNISQQYGEKSALEKYKPEILAAHLRHRTICHMTGSYPPYNYTGPSIREDAVKIMEQFIPGAKCPEKFLEELWQGHTQSIDPNVFHYSHNSGSGHDSNSQNGFRPDKRDHHHVFGLGSTSFYIAKEKLPEVLEKINDRLGELGKSEEKGGPINQTELHDAIVAERFALAAKYKIGSKDSGMSIGESAKKKDS